MSKDGWTFEPKADTYPSPVRPFLERLQGEIRRDAYLQVAFSEDRKLDMGRLVRLMFSDGKGRRADAIRRARAGVPAMNTPEYRSMGQPIVDDARRTGDTSKVCDDFRHARLDDILADVGVTYRSAVTSPCVILSNKVKTDTFAKSAAQKLAASDLASFNIKGDVYKLDDTITLFQKVDDDVNIIDVIDDQGSAFAEVTRVGIVVSENGSEPFYWIRRVDSATLEASELKKSSTTSIQKHFDEDIRIGDLVQVDEDLTTDHNYLQEYTSVFRRVYNEQLKAITPPTSLIARTSTTYSDERLVFEQYNDEHLFCLPWAYKSLELYPKEGLLKGLIEEGKGPDGNNHQTAKDAFGILFGNACELMTAANSDIDDASTSECLVEFTNCLNELPNKLASVRPPLVATTTFFEADNCYHIHKVTDDAQNVWMRFGHVKQSNNISLVEDKRVWIKLKETDIHHAPIKVMQRKDVTSRLNTGKDFVKGLPGGGMLGDTMINLVPVDLTKVGGLQLYAKEEVDGGWMVGKKGHSYLNLWRVNAVNAVNGNVSFTPLKAYTSKPFPKDDIEDTLTILNIREVPDGAGSVHISENVKLEFSQDHSFEAIFQGKMTEFNKDKVRCVPSIVDGMYKERDFVCLDVSIPASTTSSTPASMLEHTYAKSSFTASLNAYISQVKSSINHLEPDSPKAESTAHQQQVTTIDTVIEDTMTDDERHNVDSALTSYAATPPLITNTVLNATFTTNHRQYGIQYLERIVHQQQIETVMADPNLDAALKIAKATGRTIVSKDDTKKLIQDTIHNLYRE